LISSDVAVASTPTRNPPNTAAQTTEKINNVENGDLSKGKSRWVIATLASGSPSARPYRVAVLRGLEGQITLSAKLDKALINISKEFCFRLHWRKLEIVERAQQNLIRDGSPGIQPRDSATLLLVVSSYE
jgi:hypothetical protein